MITIKYSGNDTFSLVAFVDDIDDDVYRGLVDNIEFVEDPVEQLMLGGVGFAQVERAGFATCFYFTEVGVL